MTLASGENAFTIASPVANAYYKLVFDCAQTTNNGIITISKVEYIAK